MSKSVHDPLTSFQVEVTTVFFSLDASDGFLLAGGAALVAQHLTARPTYDLDFFTRQDGGDVPTAVAALDAAAAARGWRVARLTETGTFARLLISGPDELTVDLAVDSAPGRPPVVTCLGPSFDPEELAGRKLVALFDRAEARDFSDVFALASRYGKRLLMDRAAEVDAGGCGFPACLLRRVGEGVERRRVSQRASRDRSNLVCSRLSSGYRAQAEAPEGRDPSRGQTSSSPDRKASTAPR